MAARINNETPTTKTNNLSAAKLFDYVTCSGVIIEASENVFIENLPAARLGDRVKCKKGIKVIIDGSESVYINNLPAARFGDLVA